jgi:hypothetical protein
MIKFKIYHPKNGVLNTQCIRGQYSYELITSVQAESLEDVFRLAQNDFSEGYANLSIRSTSIGDIIVDVRHEKHYFISNVGFTEIPHTVVSFIDWGDQPSQMEQDFAKKYLNKNYVDLDLWDRRFLNCQIDAAITCH